MTDAQQRRQEYLDYLRKSAEYFWLERFVKERGLWRDFISWRSDEEYRDLKERGIE
jgi:hypothetical protein